MSQNSPVITSVPDGHGMRVAIATALWNGHVTGAMTALAADTLRQAGAQVETFQVPGAVELTFAASQLVEAEAFDAIIVIGCVIRGGTPHFDYVCQSVTQGITALNADIDTPVIFGLLTVDTEQDALDRVPKGAEYAQAALMMAALRRRIQDL